MMKWLIPWGKGQVEALFFGELWEDFIGPDCEQDGAGTAEEAEVDFALCVIGGDKARGANETGNDKRDGYKQSEWNGLCYSQQHHECRQYSHRDGM